MADKKSKNAFKNAFVAITKFFRDCKSEIKKITWPTTNTVFRNMGIVLAVIIVIGLFIFGLDTSLLNLLGLFMNVSK